jgi:hypothetical protein
VLIDVVVLVLVWWYGMVWYGMVVVVVVGVLIEL